MKFVYERVAVVPCPAFPEGKVTLRPIVPLILEHAGVKIEYGALVDSGADFCIFHSLVGEVLGLDVTRGKEANFGGVGGRGMVAYFHTIRLHIGSYAGDFYCGFTRDIPPDGYGILGQVGFFDHFRVLFDHPNEEIEIIPSV